MKKINFVKQSKKYKGYRQGYIEATLETMNSIIEKFNDIVLWQNYEDKKCTITKLKLLKYLFEEFIMIENGQEIIIEMEDIIYEIEKE